MEVYCLKTWRGNRKVLAEPFFSFWKPPPNLQAQAPIVEKKASEPIITVRLANPETIFFSCKKKTWLMAGSITTAFSEGGMFSCDLQVPSRDQLRPHTSSNQKDSNYLDCSLTWPLMNIAYGAGRQWQKMLPGAGVTYGSNILITRLGGTTCHCTTLYHIVPRCVVRHTPLQTDYWLKEPLVSQAEFHVAACTTRKKVATYKPNWTMQSKIIQPRAINHDWTLFHTCYNSKCETFDTQELASIMCFELKTRHPNFSW